MANLRDVLGPGLITGASDDDPSGIATYSQAGAQFGYSLGWTLLFTYPLMCSIQLINAQTGRVTGRGLAGNIRRHSPAWLLYPLICLLVAANTINLGADLGEWPQRFTCLSMVPLDCIHRRIRDCHCTRREFCKLPRYASVLRWLTLSLFAYVGTALTHSPRISHFRLNLVPSRRL